MTELKDCFGEDFSELDSMPEKLEGKRFTECRFNSLSFAETSLSGCMFDRCSFDFTRISGVIERCAFVNCSFRYANLLGAEFVGCKLTGSNLAELTNSAFLINGGDWSYTELAKLRMKKQDLGGVSFVGASLFDCRFEACRLDGVRFDSAIVNSLSLKNSDLCGASFDLVNLAQIDFKGCLADLDFCVSFARASGIMVEP